MSHNIIRDRGRWTRVLAAATLATGLSAASLAPAHADSGQFAEQSVQLTQPGSFGAAADLQLRTGNGLPVHATNLAIAQVKCSHCRGVAISFQIVVMGLPAGAPSATNLAIANNSGCTDCDALAIAYQFVVVSDTPLVLDWKGLHEFNEIRRAVEQLPATGDTDAQISAQCALYAQRISALLDFTVQVVPVVYHVERVRHIR